MVVQAVTNWEGKKNLDQNQTEKALRNTSFNSGHNRCLQIIGRTDKTWRKKS